MNRARAWPDIEADIASATGNSFRIEQCLQATGGCINAAWHLRGGDREYFVKINDAAHVAMFEAEAAGLELLRSADAVRVPQPLCWGENGARSWIVLEHLALCARGAQCDAALGARLAALHRHTGTSHGWHRDNYIGSTPQPNSPSTSWAAFWRERRLGAQLELARRKGYDGAVATRGAKLLTRIECFFSSHAPEPSLLHGDLWSGNAASDASGNPVVFDPAVYYGDREADIAMTELFGGFSRHFHAAYAAEYPLDAGYAVRKDLYNLYHVLNHLNLFGASYLRQAGEMIERLLAET
jgi:fructosamine-3-kinase